MQKHLLDWIRGIPWGTPRERLTDIGILFAILTSVWSCSVSQRGLALRGEHLSFTPALPTGDCSLWSRRFYSEVDIGLCWTLTLLNPSEDPLLIQSFGFGASINFEDLARGGPVDIETPDGIPVTFPMSIGAGAAVSVIVRHPVTVSGVELNYTYPFLVAHQTDKTPPTLDEFRSQVDGVDLVGNPVRPRLVEGDQVGWDYLAPPKIFRVVGIFTTGRGVQRRVTFSYPADSSRITFAQH